MNKLEFAKARKKLAKTQKELASLLGVSLKAIHSYEQGWRTIPSHIQRQIFFLLSSQRRQDANMKPCWERKNCQRRDQCPAWEFQAGHLCWFICGTLCDCTSDKSCKEKIEVCKECEVLTSLL
ncbi:MAG: helix-turn-helix transcriptional regulator [Deltaproteobacteria bacterium]|nr:helix-turn-helix transcriptional regulator [Deltaproteobacteria bacterium]